MMNQTLFRNTFLLAFLALSLAACSTAKVANSEEEQRLRNQNPPADMALVYIVRPSAVGAAIRMGVTCDSVSIGSTSGMRYLYAFVKPGKREFISTAENTDELLLVVEAGKTYYIEQVPTMGILYARNKLKRMDDEAGRKKLAKCKLSGDCPAYAPKK
jgi:hypothetical protein